MTDIFKNSDIRGRYPGDLDESKAVKLAGAFGVLAGGGTVVLGGDTRESTPALLEACRKGLRGAGCRVLDAGIVTTPMLNFARIHLGAPASLMVTASHNPPDENGLKPGLSEYPLPAAAMAKWKALAAQNSAPGKAAGSLEKVDVLDAYTDSLRTHFGGGSLHVVLDPGGGAACGPAPTVFRRLGYKVDVVNAAPGLAKADRPPDPVLPGVLKSLSGAIGRLGAAAGLAFDGDGDRMAAVDENGEALSTDNAMSLFAKKILMKSPGGKVVFDVKMSRAVEDVVRKAGGIAIRCPTGQLNVMNRLRAEKAVLAGEYSGHYVFPEYAPHDDALAAAVLLCRIIEEEGRGSLAGLAEGMRSHYFPSAEIRVPVGSGSQDLLGGIRGGLPAGIPFETTDGVRATFAEGWGLARASGTESALTFRFEATTTSADLGPLAEKFLAGAPENVRAVVLKKLREGMAG